MIHIRFTLFGVEIAGIDIDLPSGLETFTGVDDEHLDTQAAGVWNTLKRWWQ